MLPKKEFFDVIYNVLKPSELPEKIAELIALEKKILMLL